MNVDIFIENTNCDVIVVFINIIIHYQMMNNLYLFNERQLQSEGINYIDIC